MLQTISVSNYALIQKLEIEFYSGFSIITGETGAGKSILLGALSLILGSRAESSVLHNKEKKCVIEGFFVIEEYGLQDFFSKHDLDYSRECILRREIAPGGKSRAFINDTPVNLNLLKEIGQSLVDVHSQHQSLLLGDNRFQLKVIDEFASSQKLFSEYKSAYISLSEEKLKLNELKEKASNAKSKLDYFQFQYQQFKLANLHNVTEQEELENELEILVHAEEIKKSLSNTIALLSEDELSVLSIMKSSILEISNTKNFLNQAGNISSRLESTVIEIADIVQELERINENTEHEPNRIEEINERLDTFYSLEQKHNVASIKELIGLRDTLSEKISEIESFDDELEAQEKKSLKIEKHAKSLANKLSISRSKYLPKLESEVSKMLKNLGMPHSMFKIQNTKSEELGKSGIDNFKFLFTANKKSELQEIQKVASGGEISRLMLCVKSLLSKSLGLPSIIFDEIDTGVSGDIADKVGEIMKQMSKGMQVINITHLPQVAAKGNYHYLVYKDERKKNSETRIQLLSEKERLTELSKMLSGQDVSAAAIENARALLNQNNG
ncbi:MAG: DNA repair protein RecN [Bacteroidota bacterium]|nr:DNA repair protein RecN [Bacteroidota bacterium]